jgi:large subunit ribosomal protein L15
MKLNDLAPNEGAKKSRKRVGRGIAAGQGKTAGRGTKGQGARSGGGKGAYFEGGQMPLARRLPFKRGFTNIRRVEYQAVNLDRLAEFDFGDETVSPEMMVAIGLIKKVTEPVAVLGRGDVDAAIRVQAHRFSTAARQKIEAAGGTAEVIPFSAEAGQEEELSTK